MKTNASGWTLRRECRLAILTSHPIQYQAPIFRELANHVNLHVFFAHKATPMEQARAGFGIPFEWDVDLTSGYAHSFVTNVARAPCIDNFLGCDTPSLKQLFSEGGYNTLLVTGWHLKSYLQGIFAAKQLGMSVCVRGDSQLPTKRSGPRKAVKSVLYPMFLRLFDAALYVGQRSRDYYEYYRYPPERLFFSPHCIDTNWFAGNGSCDASHQLRNSLGIVDDVKVILFAGKLIPKKRPNDVVSAVSHLSKWDAKIEVIVAGSGPLESSLRDQAARSGVRFHFLGFQNQSAMPALYAVSDVLVVPSDAGETWGLVANEALACGCPIIVSDAVGCAPDLIRNDDVGSVYPCGDITALAEAIDKVLLNPPDMWRIRERSEEYSVCAAVNGILAALSTLQSM